MRKVCRDGLKRFSFCFVNSPLLLISVLRINRRAYLGPRVHEAALDRQGRLALRENQARGEQGKFSSLDLSASDLP